VTPTARSIATLRIAPNRLPRDRQNDAHAGASSAHATDALGVAVHDLDHEPDRHPRLGKAQLAGN
jgi:hypothetical protein